VKETEGKRQQERQGGKEIVRKETVMKDRRPKKGGGRGEKEGEIWKERGKGQTERRNIRGETE
jgi:membrane protein implicated in regulation of membrane protease activity